MCVFLQFMCVDPPRPLPDAAFDLQTALESVQHFATQTLSGVVQAQAVRGTSEEFPTGASPLPMGGGQSRTTEAREAAAAAGVREGWELWWPPRELTAALALVTARQMSNAMRCDAEPLIQVLDDNSRIAPQYHVLSSTISWFGVHGLP